MKLGATQRRKTTDWHGRRAGEPRQRCGYEGLELVQSEVPRRVDLSGERVDAFWETNKKPKDQLNLAQSLIKKKKAQTKSTEGDVLKGLDSPGKLLPDVASHRFPNVRTLFEDIWDVTVLLLETFRLRQTPSNLVVRCPERPFNTTSIHFLAIYQVITQFWLCNFDQSPSSVSLMSRDVKSITCVDVINMNCILQRAVHLVPQLQDKVGCAQKVDLAAFNDLTQDLSKALAPRTISQLDTFPFIHY